MCCCKNGTDPHLFWPLVLFSENSIHIYFYFLVHYRYNGKLNNIYRLKYQEHICETLYFHVCLYSSVSWAAQQAFT